MLNSRDPIRLVRIGEQDGELAGHAFRPEEKGPIQLVWMVNKTTRPCGTPLISFTIQASWMGSKKHASQAPSS